MVDASPRPSRLTPLVVVAAIVLLAVAATVLFRSDDAADQPAAGTHRVAFLGVANVDERQAAIDLAERSGVTFGLADDPDGALRGALTPLIADQPQES